MVNTCPQEQCQASSLVMSMHPVSHLSLKVIMDKLRNELTVVEALLIESQRWAYA